MIQTVQKIGSSLMTSFLYPPLCVSCEDSLSQKEEELCLACQFNIPKTDHHLHFENSFTKRLAGRFPFYTGAAYYVFTKEGHTQALIHAIKYEGKQQAALIIGENYGQKLKASPFLSEIEFIVPVPMHFVKERLRGFNQAEVFATGLASTMEKIMLPKALRKVRQTVSQTRKNRFGRLENVIEVFKLGKDAKQLEHKHVLLVDDVLTTGATIEACVAELLNIEGIKISIATIAITGN